MIEKVMKLKLSLNDMSNKSTNTDEGFELKRFVDIKDEYIQCTLESDH